MGPEVPPRFFWVLDLLSISTAFFLAHALAPWLKDVLLGSALLRPWVIMLSPEALGTFRPLDQMLWALVVFAPVTLLSVLAMGGYRPLHEQSRTRILLSAAVSPLLGLSALALVLFTMRSSNWSRLFVYSFTVLTAVELASYRLALRGYRRRRAAAGIYARSVLIIGSAPALVRLVAHIRRHVSSTNYTLAGYLDLPDDSATVERTQDASATPDLPCLGRAADLPAMLVHRPIHEVIAVRGATGGRWLGPVVEACDYFRVTLRVVPEALLFEDLRDLLPADRGDPFGLPAAVLRPRHQDSGALFVKRLMDVVISSALLVLLSPLFLLIAIAIKLTTPKLSVFYPWRVVGYNGRPFTGYKFTTMVADADERKAELEHLNEMSGPVFKIKDDPRITPLGRILRKFSLNELPQLWSVLKGDMSLVGPRPAYPHELKRYELWHKRKLTVKPGITCLWQIRGRNRICDFDDWVKMDFEYIDNWSLWLDCRILVRTVWCVVAGTGS